MVRARLFDELKPFAWLALAAFLAGFLSYAALGGGSRAVAHAAQRPVPAASAPASDDWNFPKRI